MKPDIQISRRKRQAALAAALALALGAGGAHFWRSLVRGEHATQGSKLIVDRRGRYLGEVHSPDGTIGSWPLPDQLPEKLLRATLAAEDRHFFEHRGVYLPSVLRAAWQDLSNLEVISGASTVAMQVARLQSPGRHGPLRKLEEAAEALLLVRDLGHERVLRQYLTIAPYGNRARGAERAARLYFDKPAVDLSWAQAAFLAALPQAPGRMNPYDPLGLSRARARSARILRALRADGALSADELKQSLGANLGLVPQPHRHPEALHAVLALAALAPARAGPILTSTIDLDLQLAAAAALRAGLDGLEESEAGNGAVLVIDPESGELLAHVGSRDYFGEDERGALDYARARRSPGSALKPFIYALALEQGPWTAASELPDTPLEFAFDEAGGAWLPEDINHVFMGPMLFREALANSRNIPALRLLSSVGVERAVRLFEKAGVRGLSFDPARYGLSLAIGGLEVTLEELVAMYTAFPNHGEMRPLRRFLADPIAPPVRLFSAASADLITQILSDPEARRPTFPAGGPLDYDYAVGVKTGTSQGHRDAWTVAFSDRLLVGAWIGNHDRRRMRKLTGGSAAAPVVHAILDGAMPARAPYRPIAAAFPPPANFETHSICPLSGLLAGPDCPDAKAELFAPGTAPSSSCRWHQHAHVDRRNGLRAGPRCPKQFVRSAAMLALPEEYDAWARAQHLELAPRAESPLCPSDLAAQEPSVRIREPRAKSRYLWDPDTPAQAAAIRFAAEVTPANEELIWIVDGAPVAKVSFPYELRWNLAPGPHTISAALAHGQREAKAVSVLVEN